MITQTRPSPGGTVNFGYHESNTGIDIRKGTGFDKSQRILQTNVIIKSCVMIGLV